MRQVKRPALSKSTLTLLSELSATVFEKADLVISAGGSHPDSEKAASDKAVALWDAKKSSDRRTKAFEEIQQKLKEMSSGSERCMYCEDSAGTDIEHFYPKAEYPWFAFLWENYLWACSFCNSNCKRELFPLSPDGGPLLINPAEEDPRAYLDFIPANGKFEAIDDNAKGKTSIEVFDLNGDIQGRKLHLQRQSTFRTLQTLIIQFDQHIENNEATLAGFVKIDIQSYPFSYVLGWILKAAQDPDTSIVLRKGVADAIARHNMKNWLL